MNHKIFTPLIFLFISFGVHSNEQIIAYNHDKSIVLTKESLQDWLAYNKQAKYRDLDFQIDAYFLEKALLKKQDKIPNNKLNRINFDHNRYVYNQSFPLYKKEIESKIQINQNQFSQLLNELQEKNKNKKDKVRLYQIFKKYPQNSNRKLKKQYYNAMDKIRKSITDLESFKEIAQSESDSQSRLRNGLIGNVYHGLFPKTLNNIVMKMQVGELSKTIKTKDGVMLFYCESHIPANVLTNYEMENTVKNTLMSHEKKIKWNQFNNEIVKDLNINVNWSTLTNQNLFERVVTSKYLNLNRQELEWLIDDKNINLNKSNESKITPILKKYFVSHYLFFQLKDTQQKALIEENVYILNEKITSEVIFELIKDSFVAPKEEALKKYYAENKTDYLKDQTYNISYIVLKINPDNKTATYNTANKLLNILKLDPNKFNELSKQYSIKYNKNLDNLNIIVPKNKLSPNFGLNVSKQILLLKENEISKLVESDNGLLWIIRLNKIELPREMTFEEAETFIDKKLGKEALEKLKNETLIKVINQQNITRL